MRPPLHLLSGPSRHSKRVAIIAGLNLPRCQQPGCSRLVARNRYCKKRTCASSGPSLLLFAKLHSDVNRLELQTEPSTEQERQCGLSPARANRRHDRWILAAAQASRPASTEACPMPLSPTSGALALLVPWTTCVLAPATHTASQTDKATRFACSSHTTLSIASNTSRDRLPPHGPSQSAALNSADATWPTDSVASACATPRDPSQTRAFTDQTWRSTPVRSHATPSGATADEGQLATLRSLASERTARL